MSQLAIKDYIANTILPPLGPAGVTGNGTGTFPTGVTIWNQFQTYRYVPKYKKLGSLVLGIVNMPRAKESRLSGARGGGVKRLVWTVPILLYAEAQPEDSGSDQFDLLVWGVRKLFAAGQTGISIVDPLTSESSVLFKIGETLEWVTSPPILRKTSGVVFFESKFSVEVVEDVNG